METTEPSIDVVESKQCLQISSRLTFIELREFLTLVEQSAVKYDPRYVLKVFRELTPLRRELDAGSLLKVIKQTVPESQTHYGNLVGALADYDDAVMDEDFSVPTPRPDIDLFLHLLVQIFLHDKKDFNRLELFNQKTVIALAQYNERTLDHIAAKIWFYVFRSKEALKDTVSIRPALQTALRTATLRHDNEIRAAAITLLLRSYLLSNDINQAYNLVEKTEFPEQVTNSVVARYYYYLARIQTIQLDYSSANECAITAIRKCPQTKSALGFLQAATKLHILIQLLTGEIPELSTFRDLALEKSLTPYLAVTRAVRLGDLNLFNDALTKYGASLKKDTNYNLVLRLRQNVIKTGIRIISLSYKKISLKDICIKLHLDSELSAEYIVAKAIKDGVIDATIEHKDGYMKSNEMLDVYSTRAPQEEFDRRIKFCMALNNDSVRAMRYPLSTNRGEIKADVDFKEREQEILQYLQEDDFF
ncbi:hypothetical protein OGAPHI_006761 [Ogataea philodendri]|uniref:PCI domain-containing protein n=1 Tax=Ogataea philodendri TaxID=1378263 RepID=A0A9P8T0M9_9ASCO|nr:uncharacterized protein OGAPHI_006761 [Ogataea philodendri]KAH3661354.1 hypothetical protein OGAPHI_006761 [Ogataea philodendri]